MSEGVTNLKNRQLWFDGASVIPSNQIGDYMDNLSPQLWASELTLEINQYNTLVSVEEQIKCGKTHLQEMCTDLNIPDEYKYLNIKAFIWNKLEIICQDFNNEQQQLRRVRVEEEWELYQKFKVVDMLLVMNYVINTFISDNVVWGCGRGSSVSSYILYILNVHDIDSVYYELDYNDFFH